jgi:hypothetical protein
MSRPMQLSDECTHLAKALARAQAGAELRLHYEPHMSWTPLKDEIRGLLRRCGYSRQCGRKSGLMHGLG